ncbi:MAG: cyclic nucleotide-binding/CBS domain-containing protein [Acidobacteriota bacterium]
MNLLKIARLPAVTISPDSSVLEAVNTMVEKEVGAVVVVERDRPKGMFTQRDLLRRVAAKQLPMALTPVSSVMTSPVKVVKPSTNGMEAVSIMVSNRFHHLPIVDDECHLLAVVSASHLLRHLVEDLSDELRSLDAYICSDGIGG